MLSKLYLESLRRFFSFSDLKWSLLLYLYSRFNGIIHLDENKIPEAELNKERLTTAKALIKSKRYDHAKISPFLYFLKQFVYIEDSTINSKFDKQIDHLTGRQQIPKKI